VTEISRSGNWKWTERVIGMESLRFCRKLVYRPAAYCLPPGDDGGRSGFECLKEGEKNGRE